MRDGWRNVDLSEIAEINPEKTPKWAPDHLIKYVDIASVAWGKNLEPMIDRREFGSAPGRARRLIRSGDVLVSTVRPNLRAMAVVPSDLDGEVASTGFAVLRARPGEVMPGFVWACVSHMRFTEDMEGKATGSNYPAVRATDVGSHRIALPPLDEQRRIVDLIGAVDDAIDSAENSAKNLFVLCERVRDQFPRVEITPLSRILESIDSGVSSKLVEGAGPKSNVITLAAIRPASFYPHEIKNIGVASMPERARLRNDDLLITRSNTPDRVGYVARAHGVAENTFFPDLVWRLVPKESLVSKEYLEQVLSSPTYRSAITSMASGTSESMRKINKANFSTISIPLPSKAEQDAYVSPLTAGEGALRSLRASIERLHALRSNLLTALLSGEHEIPASYDELLEARTT